MNWGNNGVTSIIDGLRGAAKSFSKGEVERANAEQLAGLRSAQAYSANMTGQKYGAEAEGLAFTNQQRMGIDAEIAANPEMVPHERAILNAFKRTGDTNMARFADAAGKFQQQQAITDIQGGVDPTRTGQAYAAVSGKMPFEAVGSTGRNINGLTGFGRIADEALATNYDNKIRSEIGENNAQAGAAGASAGLSNERRKEIQMGDVKSGTDEHGNPILFRAGTNGKINVLDDLAPYRKSGSSDAALQKARGRVAEQVYKDKDVEPENRAAEIEARMAMINPPKEGAKSPAPQASGKTIDAPRDATKRSAGTIYNTPKGPLQWTGTGWTTP